MNDQNVCGKSYEKSYQQGMAGDPSARSAGRLAFFPSVKKMKHS
jgi:hypothetical protein